MNASQAKYFGNSAEEYRQMANRNMLAAFIEPDTAYGEACAREAVRCFELSAIANKLGKRVNYDGLTYECRERERITNMIETKQRKLDRLHAEIIALQIEMQSL
jgi:hypothetical protein